MLLASTLTRLEKAAADNGFDRELPREGAWLTYASTQAPLRLWLTAGEEGPFLVALSQLNVARALAEFGHPLSNPLPRGACAALAVLTLDGLNSLVRRAFQLSKTLPDELLHAFEKKTAGMPASTEAERLIVQRVGQDLFRDGLLDYWEGRCPLTGLAVKELLRASHIKPWAACEIDAERLDVFNGLLLAPHLDAAFDRGFITFADDGALVVAESLSGEDRRVLGVEAPLALRGLTDGHRHYLAWHRGKVFRGPGHVRGVE